MRAGSGRMYSTTSPLRTEWPRLMCGGRWWSTYRRMRAGSGRMFRKYLEKISEFGSGYLRYLGHQDPLHHQVQHLHPPTPPPPPPPPPPSTPGPTCPPPRVWWVGKAVPSPWVSTWRPPWHRPPAASR